MSILKLIRPAKIVSLPPAYRRDTWQQCYSVLWIFKICITQVERRRWSFLQLALRCQMLLSRFQGRACTHGYTHTHTHMQMCVDIYFFLYFVTHTYATYWLSSILQVLKRFSVGERVGDARKRIVIWRQSARGLNCLERRIAVETFYRLRFPGLLNNLHCLFSYLRTIRERFFLSSEDISSAPFDSIIAEL